MFFLAVYEEGDCEEGVDHFGGWLENWRVEIGWNWKLSDCVGEQRVVVSGEGVGGELLRLLRGIE